MLYSGFCWLYLFYTCALVAQSFMTLCDPMDRTRQAPLSMGFSRQESWSGHALLQGIFLTPGLNPGLLCLLHWHVGSLPAGPPGKPWKCCLHLDKQRIWQPPRQHVTVPPTVRPEGTQGRNRMPATSQLLQPLFSPTMHPETKDGQE